MKTCFVICPIGSPGSEMRMHSDDLIELVLEPVLSDFQIIRAHEITESGAITDQIITQIRASDLCVVDLSYRRPNVYYEAGRRHETGRPYIHVVREEDMEEIDFDLAQFRYASFDLNNPRKIRACQVAIREYIEKLDSAGEFSSALKERGLADVYRTVRRIEDAVSRISTSRALPQSVSPMIGDRGKAQRNIGAAMAAGDFHQAAVLALQVFPGSKSIYDKLFYLSLAVRLDDSLIDQGLSILETVDFSDLDKDLLMTTLSSIVQAISDNDTEVQYKDRVINVSVGIIESAKLDDNGMAFIYNQMQKISYGARDMVDARKYVELAISLNGNEAAYWYNKAGIDEADERLSDAADSISQCLAIDSRDEPVEDHLYRASLMFNAADREDECRDALSKLFAINPALAGFAESQMAGRRSDE